MPYDDTPFPERVWAIVRLIPPGRVTTYGHIALLAGAPRSARQVGRALRQLPPYLAWGSGASATVGQDGQAEEAAFWPTREEQLVPWHRVINAQGRLSPPNDPAKVARQAALLRSEGVGVTDSGVLAQALEQIGWWPESVDPAGR